jgi:hypothetical protein
MNQNANKLQLEPLKLDDKNTQFFINLVLDFVYNFNSNLAQNKLLNSPDSLKLVLTGDMAGNIYKTSKKIPPKLTMTLVGGDISEDNFQRILKNMKKSFFDKIKEDEDRDDYCWLVQFEGIFDAELHPAQPANKPANEQANKPKTPKISFEIIEEPKKNQQNQNQQQLPSNNQANPNKKPQLKSGIKLVIESDKKYELPFLEIETATEFPSIQVYPNIFIPNQSGANIGPDDELSCAVLLKLHTYERNSQLFGLNEYKNHRKKRNHPELSQNNTDKTLESLLDSEYQKQYKKELNESVNSSFLEKMNQNKQKVYNDKIRALYDKCGLFYRKEYNSLFQEKPRMYGIYPNSTQQNKRENIKLDEESQKQMEPRLKNGIRVIKTESSIDFVPKLIYSSKMTESKQENGQPQAQPKLEVLNRLSIPPSYQLQNIQFSISARDSPFMKLTSFDYLPHSYEVGNPSFPLFLSDIEKIRLSENTTEYVLQFRIIPANEYNVQLPFLATKWYMILIKPDPQSSNVFRLYEETYTNQNNKNKTKRRLINQSSNLPKNQYKFYRHKVKLSSVVETYMSIVNEGMTYVCPVCVLVFSESATATG